MRFVQCSPFPCLWGVPAAPNSGWEKGETGFPQSPPCGEGLGGRSPPKNNNIFILALCAPRTGLKVVGEGA